MDRLILLRHAESLKNIEARHGAVNSPLTAKGCEQVTTLAEKMSRSWHLERCTIWCIPRRHCRETASLLRDHLPGVEAEIVEFPMKPYFMGILDGLSDGEVENRYPDLAARLASYRAGHLDIGSVSIPGATDPEVFYQNAMQALNMLKGEVGNSLVVGTRSILVGLFNVIKGNHPRAGGGYREVPWSNCGYCVFNDAFGIMERSDVILDACDGHTERH